LVINEGIDYQTDGRVATVTIQRPQARNALTPQMWVALHEVFDEFNRDEKLWVAILTGSGDQAFCSGADLATTIPAITAGQFDPFPDPTRRFGSEIFKPIISAVNGACVAGGMEILQGTDLRLAAETATFGLGEVRVGLVPGGGSHVRLPDQIPWAAAMELLLVGARISAERAYQIGLINKVVAPGELMDEARALAGLLCQNGPLAVRTAKEMAVRSRGYESAFVTERALTERVRRSQDAKEGPRAFLEKRAPRYVGR
jgi:enoyl-CoA hydratase